MRPVWRWWMNGTRSGLLRTQSGLWSRLIVPIRDGKQILGSIFLVAICCYTFVTQEANIHFSSRFENLLKFTSHRWYRALGGCCLFSFCNKANCAFKTPTNASPAPNFCSNLGISRPQQVNFWNHWFSPLIDYEIPPLIIPFRQYPPQINPTFCFKIHVWFLGKVWNMMKPNRALGPHYQAGVFELFKW